MAEQILLMDNITVIYPNGFAANRDVRLAPFMRCLEKTAPEKPP